MRRLGCRRVSVLSEAGLPGDEIRRLSSVPPCHSSPFRLLSIGQLIHLKAFHLSVRAFAEFHSQFPASGVLDYRQRSGKKEPGEADARTGCREGSSFKESCLALRC